MRKTILSVCAALALIAAASVAAADDDLVGVSGECYASDEDDDYAEGGQAYIAVDSEGNPQHDGIVDEDDPTNVPEGGAVDAVTTFANGLPDSIGDDDTPACTAPDQGEGDPPREGKDYLEVHVLGAQVCYDGDFHVTLDEGDRQCDTRPTGPPEEDA